MFASDGGAGASAKTLGGGGSGSGLPSPAGSTGSHSGSTPTHRNYGGGGGVGLGGQHGSEGGSAAFGSAADDNSVKENGPDTFEAFALDLDDD